MVWNPASPQPDQDRPQQPDQDESKHQGDEKARHVNSFPLGVLMPGFRSSRSIAATSGANGRAHVIVAG